VARVLLGWELGAGRGHAVWIARIARSLRARGHEPVLAVQQVGALAGEGDVWQAPLWPGQIVALARRAPASPRSMGDILATLGLADGAAVQGILHGWDRLLAAVRPDLVAADFAPGLMMAARGRLPLLACGNGFTLPPSGLDRFPVLGGGAARDDEGELLDRLNGALSSCGRPPLPALPGLFAGDVMLVATFAELDPYRAWRPSGQCAPVTDGPVPMAGSGRGLFVYLSAPARLPAGFIEGVAAARLPTALHARGLAAADVARLRNAGLRVEPEPVPFARIAQETSLLLSQGGLGFVSSGLLAGLPQLVLPCDMEKGLTGQAVEAAGLGACLSPHGFRADALAEMLQRLAGDSALAARARAAAADFRARTATTAEEETLAAIEALLR